MQNIDVGERNTGIHTSIAGRDCCWNCGGFDCGCYSYWPYAIDFSFFIGERKKHYEQIRTYVLGYLRQLAFHRVDRRTEQIFKRLTFENEVNQVVFRNTRKHLNIDGVDVAYTYEQFSSEISEYNESLDSIETSVKEIVRNKINVIASENDPNYSTYIDNIFQIVGSVFDNFIASTGDVHSMNKNYDSNGYKALKVAEKDADETTIRTVINEIVGNAELIGNMEELQKSNKELTDLQSTITKHASDLNQLIAVGEYDVKHRCCPTVFRLIRRYVF